MISPAAASAGTAGGRTRSGPVPGRSDHAARSQARFVSWVADVLVYIVVLNLFVEWAPAVIVESFTFSILMIVALIIALMAARAIVQVIYQRLGHDQEPVADTP
jgi:hypothetical protein